MLTIVKKDIELHLELVLAESEKNILPFRILCEKLGADACIVSVNTEKEIDFDSKEHIIAKVSKKTLLKKVDGHNAIVAIFVDEKLAKDATATCKKPIISTKDADITITPDAEPKGENILKITKQETPENFNALLNKTDAKALVIGDIALSQPVIFEQTKNYFEKGYYNKITRKRREKTLAEFEKILSKYPGDKKIVDELKELIMSE